MPNGDAGSERLNRALEWLNAPREELPQEYHDAFALWCEVDAIDRQVRELEITQPVGVTEILASRAALKELHAERARLLAVLEGREQPAPAANASPAPVVADSASNAPVKKWTAEKLAELKAYRAAHTMPETAKKFGITEQRIRRLLPGDKPKIKGYSAFTRHTK